MKVLLAEDSRFFRRLLEANLQSWGHTVVSCADGIEAWALLSSPDSPKLAILDWEMPGMKGVEICQELRKTKGPPYVYVILLTAKSRKEDVVEGLESGADDYITKPFDPLELKVRIRAAVRIVQLQEDLIQALKTMENQAKQDSLTSLWNHSTILEILNNELDRSRRQRTPVAVIMADIDHFKRINDTYGHLVGDEVIKTMAQRIRAELRSYDFVGRYGGEEFLIVLPNTDVHEGVIIAERLRHVTAEAVSHSGGRPVRCTVSFGVAAEIGSTRNTAADLVNAADQALYHAKTDGRNCVRVAKRDRCPLPAETLQV